MTGCGRESGGECDECSHQETDRMTGERNIQHTERMSEWVGEWL